MNRVKEVQRINKRDLETQLKSDTAGNVGKWDVSKSWHAQYKDSAYVYVGGLPTDLSEGDVMVIFSQFGDVVDVNMPRDKVTGKSKAFAFIAYEDQRSTVLAVDNFNGATILGRTLRVDHCADYKDEQKKDPDAIPEHVARRLTEKQLEEKRDEIAQRNEELERDTATKVGVFAEGRGTAETDAQAAERQVRSDMVHDRELDADARRRQHIEAVLASRGRNASAIAAEESAKAARWEQKKKERDAEDKAAARKRSQGASAAYADLAHEGGAAAPTNTAPVAAAKWDRLMGGGGSKKKQKKAGSLSFKGGGGPGDGGAANPLEHAGGGAKESLSVEATNAMRASLGLKPLR